MANPSFAVRALHAFRRSLQAGARPTAALSRQERLGLIFSAIERCGADCPACAIWALERDRYQAVLDAELTERRLSC